MILPMLRASARIHYPARSIPGKSSKELRHEKVGNRHDWCRLVTIRAGTSAGADDKGGRIADLVKDATVTIDQAVQTASEKVPATVVEAELERKHGKTVWEVEGRGADGNVTEIHIDAGTGAVIDTEAKKDKKQEGKKKGGEKGK